MSDTQNETFDWKELVKEFQSPYEVAKIESIARNRNIVPQKIYGYVREKRILAKKNALGHWQVSKEETLRYVEEQVARDELRKRFAR